MCTVGLKTGSAIENKELILMELPWIGYQSLVVSHRALFSDLCCSLYVYINDIKVRLNKFIAKFADDTKIGNSVISDSDRQSL